MLVDQFAPDAPFVVERSVTIDADPPDVMRAALTANLLDARAARFLTTARDLPNRVLARIRRRPVDTNPERIAFGDIAESDEWHELAHEPGREWVAGAIGRFWQRDYGWVDFEPDEFVTYAEPDHAKTVISLRAEPEGPGRTRLVYESRTVATDEVARRHFARYWRVLKPFVGLLQRSALASIRREAEAAGALSG